MTNRLQERTGIAAALLVAGLTLAACGGGGDNESAGAGEGDAVSGAVIVDGSSTVEPLSSAAAELFMEENPDVNVTVGTSGTGGGFEKFCAGETDISDASRPIKESEIEKCKQNNIQFSQLTVANDALSVVVNPQNDWATCLTVEQLKKMWEPNSTVNNWNQVDPAFPNEPLKLFGAGSDSGTFDYFTEAINGEEGASRTDYNPTEDDNVTIQGVSATKGALGYFGYSYLEENADKVKGVQIDGGDGCVAPSVETAQDGTYKPLSRPLFIYISDAALKKPQVVKFADFYLENNKEIVEAAKFIPLTDEQLQTAKDELAALHSKVS
ncbi:PstS family phosphate ABC transporter substrate-binding protein [Mycobacterium hubeiense]|uniref:PstS family phosphate ABC transporter substrate-binding protein n=1 Tax=Mycobacterium hubeiense TaxID=1867256 RepID=UPI0018EBEA40|nr:PstS family phosphate ABC transporter substrate-binding protein [Mycobacterium sp. QGD 101]